MGNSAKAARLRFREERVRASPVPDTLPRAGAQSTNNTQPLSCKYSSIARQIKSCHNIKLVDPLPEDAPFFVKDYHDYYKTDCGYHARSLNSNGGWNMTGCQSFMNQPILDYSNEIRSAVLVMHGEKAHSGYFSRDAYAAMVEDNPYADNKELLMQVEEISELLFADLYNELALLQSQGRKRQE